MVKENVKGKESFDLSTAISMLKQNAEKKPRKFVESVDIAFNLNIDAKQSNQNIRSFVELPAGSGRNVRVIVFTDNEDLQQKALKAGAVKAGLAELAKEIEGGFLDFDYCVATPDAMKSLGKIAKILGPRGLMPNPKNGNISDDVEGSFLKLKPGMDLQICHPSLMILWLKLMIQNLWRNFSFQVVILRYYVHTQGGKTHEANV